MPKALVDSLGYKFFFWSNDNAEPQYVHVCKGKHRQTLQSSGLSGTASDWNTITFRFRKATLRKSPAIFSKTDRMFLNHDSNISALFITNIVWMKNLTRDPVIPGTITETWNRYYLRINGYYMV